MLSGPRNVMHFTASNQLCSALSSLGSTMSTTARTLLFRCGEDVRGVYLIESGEVELSLGDGLRSFTRICTAGSLLGVPATMTGSGYTLSAEVLKPGTVRFIPRADFLSFLGEHPNYCLEIVQMLATEVHRARHQCA
jgi:CRP-like cAMP-binding protein